MNTYEKYIKNVRKSGYLAFDIKQAAKVLSISANAMRLAVYRLKKQGDIISPARGFYVIVPPEYQTIGCLPPDLLIPILMDYWQQDYYIGLLSAADHYGAAHQKPQVYQVITNKQLKPLVIGKVAIEFIYKKSLLNCPTKSATVQTGYLKFSSPELIAMDLLLYQQHAGGLNNIATVLSELVENIDPNVLIKLAKTVREKCWLQKLGFILENSDSLEIDKTNSLLLAIEDYLAKHKIYYVKLSADRPKKGGSYNAKWKIIVNTTIEIDE